MTVRVSCMSGTPLPFASKKGSVGGLAPTWAKLNRDGNKLSEHRYLRLNIPNNRVVTFSMIANPAPSQPSNGFDCTADPDDPENHDHSDPDYLVWRDGQLFWIGFGCEPNSEVSTTNGLLAAGDYVIDINDFRHEDSESPVAYPDQVCFDFTAN